MNKHYLSSCVAIVLLAGCAGAPRLSTPDGRHRIALNAPDRIDDYKARIAEQQANHGARQAMSRDLDAVKRDILDIKAYLIYLETEPASKTRRNRLAQRSNPTRHFHAFTAGEPQPIAPGTLETVEVREQSLVFRVPQGPDATDFRPTQALRISLIKASRNARLVEIRGRTDADVAEPASEQYALARAQAARRYLVAQGIPTAKIKVTALGAGGFIADNATDAGKARNRRVEIETMDLDTAAYKTVVTTAKGNGQ